MSFAWVSWQDDDDDDDDVLQHLDVLHFIFMSKCVKNLCATKEATPSN